MRLTEQKLREMIREAIMTELGPPGASAPDPAIVAELTDEIGDRAAGAIKSGGTTRRAAKMVTVDVDHPDIEAYVDWKVIEEQKVAALVAGSKLAQLHMGEVMAACHDDAISGDDRFDPRANKRLKKAIIAARGAMIPENYVQRVIQFARQGYTEIEFKTELFWPLDGLICSIRQQSGGTRI